jgi:hypothetical protein
MFACVFIRQCAKVVQVLLHGCGTVAGPAGSPLTHVCLCFHQAMREALTLEVGELQGSVETLEAQLQQV